MHAPESRFRLAVVSAGGADGCQTFPKGAGQPGDPGHLPVNFHAYAACTQGAYLSGDDAMPEADDVLLLLGRDMRRSARMLARLKAAGKKVVVTLKETGLQQVGAGFQEFANWSAFREVCGAADGALATTHDTEPLYVAASRRLPLTFLPPPYPLEEWDLSPRDEGARSGVFIGTRQLFVTSRNHALALALVTPVAEEAGQEVTVISGRASDLTGMKRLLNKVVDYSGGWHERFAAEAGRIQVIKRQLPAVEYLRLMAGHRLVFQLDQSSVPGQVAGDALLCRMPCVGGNGTAERLVFPDLCGHGRTTGEVLELTRRLLADGDRRRAMVEKAVGIALEKMCFSSARRQLAEFYASLTMKG